MKVPRYSLQWRESGGDYVCVGSLGPGTAVRPKDMRFSVHADDRRLCSFRLSLGSSSRCPLSSGGSFRNVDPISLQRSPGKYVPYFVRVNSHSLLSACRLSSLFNTSRTFFLRTSCSGV